MNMQTLQEVNMEQLARLFHHYKEALAHDCAAQKDQNSNAWDQTPQSERKLMAKASARASSPSPSPPRSTSTRAPPLPATATTPPTRAAPTMLQQTRS